MPTPWFLQQLGLDDNADARAIKRAYAVRLRQIDQATDIDGFNALHHAYKAAQAWVERRASLVDANGQTLSVDTSGGNHQAMASVVMASVASEPHLAPTPAGIPASRDPADAARAALEALRADLADQQNAIVALGRQYRLLGDEHLSAPLLFETMVIDQLARGGIAQRLALFHAAQKQFAWSDVVHLADLKARGAWVMQLQKESLAVDALRQSLAPALEAIDMREAGHVDHIPGQALKCWPELRSALQAYPRYFSLCFSQADAQEWEQAYQQIARVVLPSVNLPPGTPLPDSPAAHRARRGTPPSGTVKPMVGVSAIFILVLFRLLASIAGPHDSDSVYAPPPPPQVSQPATTQLPMQMPIYSQVQPKHDYVMPPPYVPRRHAGDPPPSVAHNTAQLQTPDPASQVARTQHMGGPGRCDWLYERVHMPRWDVSGDTQERQRIAEAVQTCRQSGHWSTTPITDPIFARLGIAS